MALNLRHHHQAPPQQTRTEFYSGQWTKEETDYVACLMDGFRNGTLDIPDGTSLRFFIAAKLGCKPKRVSKKYERSGYNGKQVYRRDTNVPQEEQDAYRQRLNDCETKFKESRTLVVSMQEAKTDSKPSTMVVRETPVISLTSSSNNAMLEDRLVQMRSQMDRATTMFGLQQAQQVQSFPRYGMMGAGPLNPAAAPMPLSPEMIQAMMMQRQQRAAAFGGARFGAPMHHGMGSSLPTAAAGPTNKLLIDLYQRRQQLIMSYMGGAGPAGPGAGAMPSPRAMSPTGRPASPQDTGADKRGLEELQAAEEQARKRARAA